MVFASRAHVSLYINICEQQFDFQNVGHTDHV